MEEHPVIALVRSKVPDPGRPFTIIADLAALPGRGGEVAAAIAGSGAVGLTRAEPGCLEYDITGRPVPASGYAGGFNHDP